MDNFMPPQVLPPYQTGELPDSRKFAALAASVNRGWAGAYPPSVNYPDISASTLSIGAFIVIGSSPDYLFCQKYIQGIRGNLVAVLKPPVLTAKFNINPLYLNTYSNAEPPMPSPAYAITYLNGALYVPVYSLDGNARVAAPGGHPSEVQVIDKAYGSTLNEFIFAMTYQSAKLDAGYFINGQNAEDPGSIDAIPSYLVGLPVNYIDINIDARHWVAQTVTS